MLPSLCDFDSVHDEAGWIADTVTERKDKDIPYLVSDPGAHWHVYGRGNNSFSYLLSPLR